MTQTRERIGLGTMANFTTHETLRRLFTIPYMTFTITDGHKVRKALLKNDLDQVKLLLPNSWLPQSIKYMIYLIQFCKH